MTEPGDAADPLADAYTAHRQRAFDVAYRMLGSVAAAEDAVHDAFVRLSGQDLGEIADIRGWLVTVTSRLCLDQMGSAASRRRAYVGPWLPEPVVVSGDAADPGDRVTLDDSVRIAMLVVLEQLSPPERTSFLLHDVFAFDFDAVAEIVGRSPAACRQLASRARRRIRQDREHARFSVPTEDARRVAERFASACRTGQVDALLEVLDPDVVGEFDSGGHVPGAPLAPVHGASTVAAILAEVASTRGLDVEVVAVNGEPGVLFGLDDRVVAVIVVAPIDGRVGHILAIGNPDKLSHLHPR